MPHKDPAVRKEYMRLYNERRREELSAKRKERYAQNRERLLENAREYRKKFPEKGRFFARRYYREHREQCDAWNLAWKARNRDRVNQWAASWRERNRELSRSYSREYYHRRESAEGSHTQEQWLARVEYFGWRCVYCGCELTRESLERDHFFPLIYGGANWASNLVPTCHSCNCKKGTGMMTRKLWAVTSKVQ